MLAEREPLALVGRADRQAVKLVGTGEKALIDEAADDLPVFDEKGHLMRAHFEDGAAPRPSAFGKTETGIDR